MLLNHKGTTVQRFNIRADQWNQCLNGVKWDRPTTLFPVCQAMAATWDTNLVREIAAVIEMSAGPLALPWLKGNVPAILQAWWPGEEGGHAVADVLFGDANPAGRLPHTVYAADDQVPPPDQYDISQGFTYMFLRGAPLFPASFAEAGREADRDVRSARRETGLLGHGEACICRRTRRIRSSRRRFIGRHPRRIAVQSDGIALKVCQQLL